MLVSISYAAKQLGVCTKTLRRWEIARKLIPFRTIGNHRRYETDALGIFLRTGEYHCPEKIATKAAAIYARVSAGKQKTDLKTQTEYLVTIAQRAGYQPTIYTDIASGLNDQRKGLIRLVRDGFAGRFDRVYLTYLDRMARFGTHLIQFVLNQLGIQIIAVHTAENSETIEQTLANDVIAVITSYSGKIHRLRRGKNQIATSVIIEKILRNLFLRFLNL